MEELTQKIFGPIIVVSSVTSYDLVVALATSTLFTFVIAKLYMLTHSGYSYSKSFLHTIVLVGVTVTLIMVIIGSDIARAFALVGAMSIVRFRTPIKDARDLVFVFAAIAIGMACGTQFHVFAGIFTAFLAILMLGFHYSRFGDLPSTSYVVKLRINASDRERVAELCGEMCRRYSVVSVTRSNGAEAEAEVEDVIYEVELKRGVTYKDLLDRLTRTVKPLSVNMLVGEGHVNA